MLGSWLSRTPSLQKEEMEQRRSKRLLRLGREGRGLGVRRSPTEGSPARVSSHRRQCAPGSAMVQPRSPQPPLHWGVSLRTSACVSVAPSLPGGDRSSPPQFPPLRRMSKRGPALHFTIVNKRLKMPEK